MIVKRIDNLQDLDRFKSNWEAVYSGDRDTTIFVSWGWLRAWIDTGACEWAVLAVQPDSKSPYIAFMPLGIQDNPQRTSRKLFFGCAGHPGADSTGFVCLPQYVEKAIPAFASFIQRNIKWDIFEMRSVFDPRLDLFLRCFSKKRFYLQEHESNSCPHIMLPHKWDQYLNDFLSKNTREKLKYYTRKIEGIRDFRVTHAEEDTLETQIEALLSLLQKRFGQRAEDILKRYRAIFRRCFESDCLLLTIFWDGTIPIAGEAAFVDQKKKIISNFKKAFNDEFADFRPGHVMTGHVIRYAIENGFRIYDFGEGDEKYKFSFGATERFHRNVNIVPNTFLSSLKKRVPLRVKKLLRDVYNKNVKKYLTAF